MRDSRTLRFLKFLSVNAPSDRFDLKLVVPIKEDIGGESESEEEESEEEEN